jgi:hypothetical protein
MSGGYNQIKPNWVTHRKRGGGLAGRYSKYENILVVIAPYTGTLLLTQKCVEMLGFPRRVKILRDDNAGMIGIVATEAEDSDGYVVPYDKSNRKMHKVSGGAALKEIGVVVTKPNAHVYEALMHNNVLTVNLRQTPEVI